MNTGGVTLSHLPQPKVAGAISKTAIGSLKYSIKQTRRKDVTRVRPF